KCWHAKVFVGLYQRSARLAIAVYDFVCRYRYLRGHVICLDWQYRRLAWGIYPAKSVDRKRRCAAHDAGRDDCQSTLDCLVIVYSFSNLARRFSDANALAFSSAHAWAVDAVLSRRILWSRIG